MVGRKEGQGNELHTICSITMNETFSSSFKFWILPFFVALTDSLIDISKLRATTRSENPFRCQREGERDKRFASASLRSSKVFKLMKQKSLTSKSIIQSLLSGPIETEEKRHPDDFNHNLFIAEKEIQKNLFP